MAWLGGSGFARATCDDFSRMLMLTDGRWHGAARVWCRARRVRERGCEAKKKTPDFDAAHEHASPLAPNVGESGQTSHAIMQCHIAPRRAQRAEKLGGMWFVGRVGQGLRMEPGGEVTA